MIPRANSCSSLRVSARVSFVGHGPGAFADASSVLGSAPLLVGSTLMLAMTSWLECLCFGCLVLMMLAADVTA